MAIFESPTFWPRTSDIFFLSKRLTTEERGEKGKKEERRERKKEGEKKERSKKEDIKKRFLPLERERYFVGQAQEIFHHKIGKPFK